MLAALPKELHGLRFIDGPIEAWRMVCEEPGVLLLLVPYADVSACALVAGGKLSRPRCHKSVEGSDILVSTGVEVIIQDMI